MRVLHWRKILFVVALTWCLLTTLAIAGSRANSLVRRNESLTWFYNAVYNLETGEDDKAEFCLRKALDLDRENEMAMVLLNGISKIVRAYREANTAGLVRPLSDFTSDRPGLVRDIRTGAEAVIDKSIDWDQPVRYGTHSVFNEVAWELSNYFFRGNFPARFSVSFFPREKMKVEKDGVVTIYKGVTIPFPEDGEMVYAVILPEDEKLADVMVTFFNEMGNVVCPNPDRLLNEAASFAVQEVAREHLAEYAPGFSEAYFFDPSFHDENFHKVEWKAWKLAKRIKARYGSFEEAYETLADARKFEQRKGFVEETVAAL